MSKFDPYSGAVRLGDDHTLPTLWASLHLSAKVASDFADDSRVVAEIEGMERSDLFLLNSLADIEVKAWSEFCEAAGWTLYGAVAISWCKGATLQDVADAWTASGSPLKLSSAFFRARRLIKPDLLPKTRSLRELHEIAGGDAALYCVLLASETERIRLDLSSEEQSTIPDVVMPFLRAASKHSAAHLASVNS